MEGQEQQQQQAAPLVDLDKLNEMFEQRLKDNLKVFAQEQQQARQAEQEAAQAAEQQRLAQEQSQKDTFGQVIAPYLTPVAQSLNFKIDDVADRVKFYTENPDAVAKSKEIETQFQELAKQGRPHSREDIDAWMRGREAKAKSREEATQAALQASTINEGAAQRAALQNKDPLSMTQDERRDFLKMYPF